MPTVPVGDILRAIIPTNWKWVRRALEMVRGLQITRGGTTIVLSERDGATPPRTGLDQPAKVEPPPIGGPRR
jgi:hypothetical protein